jgi:hypothetical protein
VTEDGNERDNTFLRNFVSGVWGEGGRESWAREGVGFWFRGPLNYVYDNVATNVMGTGVEASYGFEYYQRYVGSPDLPSGWARAPESPGEIPWKKVDLNGSPLTAFSGNEVYGATPGGLTLWWVGIHGSTPRTDVPSEVDRFRAWHVFHIGYYGYETHRIEFRDLVLRGDWRVSEKSIGMTHGDYPTSNNWIDGAAIEGFWLGIETSYVTMGEWMLSASTLRNYTNALVGTMWSVGGASDLPPRKLVFSDNDFHAPAGHPLRAIEMKYSPPVRGMAGRNYVQRDEVEIRDAAGLRRLYYAEQAANFIVPATNANEFDARPSIGCPEAGLTNIQAWAKYRIAVAGEVAPSDVAPDPRFPGGLTKVSE